MPKVSVILTSYNHGKFILESITSVLNQTFSDFELIIIDDASTDNSWEIITSFKDPRIRAIQNPRNMSKGNIKRTVDKYEMGEYIAVHHSDDVWEPTKLEKQVAHLDHYPDIAAVFTQVKVISEEGLPFADITSHLELVFEQPNRSRFEWLNYFFYKGNALAHPSVLIRTNCYKKYTFKKALIQVPDYDFWVKLCLDHEIYILQEKLMRLRILDNAKNVSASRPDSRIRWQFEYFQLLENYRNIPNANVLIKIFPEASNYINSQYVDVLYALGRIAVESGNFAPTKLFGLNLLFEALNDPKRASKLEEHYHFDEKLFLNFTGNLDIFSVEIVNSLNQTISEQSQLIKQLTAQNEVQRLENEALRQEVLFYSLSRSWSITRPLRKIAKIIKGKMNV